MRSHSIPHYPGFQPVPPVNWRLEGQMMAGPRPISDKESSLISSLRKKLEHLNIDNDDFLEEKSLVRFIRARNGNLVQAETMAKRNIQWISDFDTASLPDFTPPPLMKEKLPWKILGHDEFGGAVVLIRGGLWDPGDMSYPPEQWVRYIVQLIHTLVESSKKMAREEWYIPQISVIMDLEGISWTHYLCTNARKPVTTSLGYLEANFPECMRIGFYLNSPSTFGIMWSLAKPFLSPATKEKLNFFTASEGLKAKSLILQYYEGLIPNSALEDVFGLLK